MTLVNVALRLRVAFITPTSLASFPPPRFGPRLEVRYCGSAGFGSVRLRAFHGAFGRGHRDGQLGGTDSWEELYMY